MQTNTVPTYDTTINTTGCCPRFNPVGWDNRELHFEDKKFVRAKTKSVMHIPVDMGRVFARVLSHIEDTNGFDPENTIVLSREISPWEAEHFFAVSADVSDEEMTTLSGDYITRVFEGSFRRAKDWMHEMEIAAKAKGKTARQVYMYYTTCPKCAQVYGENYLIGVAEI